MKEDVKPVQVDIACHVDDRGFLYQLYRDNNFPDVKRVYVVGNFSRGVIRGLHRHNEEWKAYFLVSGTAKFIAADTTGNVTTYILSTSKPSILIVPPNYSHGWISLTDNTILIGLSNKTLEESLNDDFREDPFKYGKDVWETKPR